MSVIIIINSYVFQKGRTLLYCESCLPNQQPPLPPHDSILLRAGSAPILSAGRYVGVVWQGREGQVECGVAEGLSAVFVVEY